MEAAQLSRNLLNHCLTDPDLRPQKTAFTCQRRLDAQRLLLVLLHRLAACLQLAAFDTLKSKLQLENFSSKTEAGVKQDFYATVYLIRIHTRMSLKNSKTGWCKMRVPPCSNRCNDCISSILISLCFLWRVNGVQEALSPNLNAPTKSEQPSAAVQAWQGHFVSEALAKSTLLVWGNFCAVSSSKCK